MSPYSDPSSTPDDNQLYDIDHRSVDDAINGPDTGFFGDPDTTPQDAAAALDDTTRARTMGLPGGAAQDTFTGSSPSPDDILRNSLPGPQVASPTTPDDILRNALNANPGPAQHPQTAEGMFFQNQNPDGGSFPSRPGSALSVEQQAAQAGMPNGGTLSAAGIPGNLPPGGGPVAPSGLPGGTGGFNQPLLGGTPVGPQTGTGGGGDKYAQLGQYQNDPWARQWLDQNGYFNPQFNTADSVRQELQRGGTANWEQAQRMRGANADIDAIVDAIKRTPDYFQGANTQSWIGAHNNQIANDVNGGVYGKNQAAIGNVLNQRVAPLANPLDQAHAEMTSQMQKTLLDSLVSLGVDPKSIVTGFDNYGNAKIGYTSRSGTPEVINASFVDLANAIDQLRQRAAAAQQPAAPPAGGGGGGGYPPRGGGYSAPRGGYTPPGGGGPPGGPPGGNPRPAPEVFPGGRPVPAGEGGYPTAVQSAYAFNPAIMPGGFSPYDEPTPNTTSYGDTNFQPNAGTVGFGPFPAGSAGNPGTANGSNPEQRYAPPSGYIGPVEQAPRIPVELVGQPPEVIAEMRRRGIIP